MVNLYVGDLLIGFLLPIYIHVRHRGAGTNAVVRRLFWLGVLIGTTWEVPIFFSAIFSTQPLVRFITEPPLHPFVFLVSHSLWDGGLFLAGLVFVRALLGPGILLGFRRVELALFVLWGQLSELMVEVTSVTAGGWVYVASHPWNVVLFELGGHPITLLPQLIWLELAVLE